MGKAVVEGALTSIDAEIVFPKTVSLVRTSIEFILIVSFWLGNSKPWVKFHLSLFDFQRILLSVAPLRTIPPLLIPESLLERYPNSN